MKLTEVEKIILENTDARFKYIARDRGGYLYLYADKPIKKRYGLWDGDICGYMAPFNHLFQKIKWKNKEPYKFR